MNSPGAILRRRRARPPRPGRRPFQVEALERRDLPASLLTGVLTTTPADGASVVQAPPSMTITFDPAVVAQLDMMYAGIAGGPADQTLPGIFSFDGGQEIEIDQVNSDGSTTPILGTLYTPTAAQSLTATTLSDGSVQAQLVVSLPTGASALGPGTYQVDFFDSNTTLLAQAFAGLDPTSPWATATGPIPVATFTVTGQGPTIAGAADLGTVGAQVQTVSGALAPGYYPSAVEFYRFELPQGPTWQLDAQVLAQAIGSPVQGGLALLDASGAVIATRAAGSGNASGTIDPALIRDLPGGTYYLGVSTAGDLPGTSTGYDPVGGMPGTGGLGQPAGSYRLAVSATPVVAPTALTSSSLLYADPGVASPTGLALAFSGPVDAASMEVPSRQETALQVVDSSGRTWPILLASADATGRLGFVFGEPLPPGNYSLIAPAQGGLTDAGGRPVVGPWSSAPSLLATWTVGAPTGPAASGGASVVWPGPAGAAWNAGLSGTATVEAGGSASDAIVALVPGWYALGLRPGSAAGAAEVRVESASGATVLDAGAPAGPKTSYVYLMPGTYRLAFDAVAGPASIDWTFRLIAIDYEKLLNNGVGQAPALALPTFAPAPGPIASIGMFPGALPSPSPTPTATPATAGATTAGTEAAPIATPSGAGTSSLSFGLLPISLEAGPAGLPAGPTAMATGSALALAPASIAGNGLPAASGGLGRPWSWSDPDRTGDVPKSDPVAATAAVGADSRAPVDDPAAESARADAMALAMVRDEPVARLAGWIAARLPGGPPTPSEPRIAPAELDETLLAAVGEADEGGEGRRPALARADLGVPLVVLVGTALSYRLARPVGKWWRRDRAEARGDRRPHRIESARTRLRGS